MYLICLHSKIFLKWVFAKVGFLKFRNCFRHSLSIAMWWNKLCWHQQRLPNRFEPNFLDKKFNEWLLHIANNFDRFFDTNFLIFFKNKCKSKWKIGLQSIVVHTILSGMGLFFFFWDKNWAAESVLGQAYITAPSRLDQ